MISHSIMIYWYNRFTLCNILWYVTTHRLSNRSCIWFVQLIIYTNPQHASIYRLRKHRTYCMPMLQSCSLLRRCRVACLHSMYEQRWRKHASFLLYIYIYIYVHDVFVYIWFDVFRMICFIKAQFQIWHMDKWAQTLG